MTRRVFLLMGLAILAVVLSHAAGWGQIAMFLWTDRYRPVTVPNFDQLGTLPYYALLLIRQLTLWAVPAFLFVSGFFVAYAARGSQSAVSWKMVWTRVRNLLVPYLIWSGVIFVGDALQGNTYTALGYLARIVTGQADGTYFYVPLLCQFYLLAPLIVPLAKTRGQLLLGAAAVLQAAALGASYLALSRAVPPALDLVARVLLQPWLVFLWAVYFPLGIVVGCRLEPVKEWLARHRWQLLLTTIVLAGLAIAEPEAIYRIAGQERRFTPLTLATSLYSVAFILCFLAFGNLGNRLSGMLSQLGTKAYGTYLLHMKVMEFSARAIRQFAPWMLAHQVLLFMPVMFTVGLGVPLLFMAGVAKSPARKYYRYLFG
jgi:membrane-bound acyltransferase YfiQ involved in biofilm formation